MMFFEKVVDTTATVNAHLQKILAPGLAKAEE